MQEQIKVFDILSEKTRNDIKFFVTNSSISDDPERKKKFYDIIQRVIFESSIGSKDKIKSK
jgi:hypothetical protein